jgi:hypothetical protein
MSENWKTAIICSIHNGVSQRSNYKEISLLNVSYKIFTNVLYKRFFLYIEEIKEAVSVVLE